MTNFHEQTQGSLNYISVLITFYERVSTQAKSARHKLAYSSQGFSLTKVLILLFSIGATLANRHSYGNEQS